MNENKYYTITQAAEVCSVSRATMWRWVKAGKIKAGLTIGKHHRISRDILLKFIEENDMSSRLRKSIPKKRILIVDDDPGIRKLLGKMLISHDYAVDYASDGFEAGLKTIKFKPDLMVLDLIMPKVDGFEVCRRLKEDKDTEKIKIMIVSGEDTEENRERVFDCGADFFMSKPVDNKIFIEQISNLLNHEGING